MVTCSKTEALNADQRGLSALGFTRTKEVSAVNKLAVLVLLPRDWRGYSTVTELARLRGWSTSHPWLTGTRLLPDFLQHISFLLFRNATFKYVQAPRLLIACPGRLRFGPRCARLLAHIRGDGAIRIDSSRGPVCRKGCQVLCCVGFTRTSVGTVVESYSSDYAKNGDPVIGSLG